MLRMILATAFALTLAGAANAADFRIGDGNINADSQANGGDVPLYFDTYPGNFCGVKALKVQVINTFGNVDVNVKIGRVYFAFQDAPANGPFAAYSLVNQTLGNHQSTAWIQVPSYHGSCLKKVRVYASSTETLGDHNIGQVRLAVIGTK